MGHSRSLLQSLLSYFCCQADASSFPLAEGGLAIQSALTYYPSLRKEVSQYISLAGSLHGTTNVAVVAQANLTNTLRDPAVWQQGYTSNWVLTNREKGGWYNWCVSPRSLLDFSGPL